MNKKASNKITRSYFGSLFVFVEINTYDFKLFFSMMMLPEDKVK